jgi:CubicO group peptidase (beta-lactamase class C family)
MQRKEFVGATVAGTLGWIAATAPARSTAAAIATNGTTSAATKPVDDFMFKFMREFEIPAGSFAIAKDGRLVYARAFGHRDLAKQTPATPRDRFRIASSSKPFTAVAILGLVETGRLRLDDRAFDILSDFVPPNGTQEDPRLRTITIRNLLEHTAGFDSTQTDPQFQALRAAADALGKPRPATHTDIIKYMMGRPLAFSPGTKYLYSNLGYNILGRVIEHVASTQYGEYVKARVLVPAGISRMELGRTKPKDRLPDEVEAWDSDLCPPMYSVYEDEVTTVRNSYGCFSMEAIDAHGGWVASTIDLTRFLNAVGGTSDAQLLSPSTVKTMLAKPDLAQYRTAHEYYALGWSVSPSLLMAHTGALSYGTSSLIGRLPNGLTYAACFNRVGYDTEPFVTALVSGSVTAVARVAVWPPHDLYAQYT